MPTTPWMTSTDLLISIKRKIMFPTSQNTLSDEDILALSNEEMMMSQVPSVLQYNQEYFVTTKTVALVANVSKYSIPERAIGQKFREVFYVDQNGNLLEMTRIDSSNRAYFNNSGANVSNISQYYIEGNEVVLVPNVQATPTGSLMFVYFLRPNQLVLNERAAICSGFQKTITVGNVLLSVGDTLLVGSTTLTAVAGSPGANEFQIGATSDDSASNILAAILASGEADGTVLNNVISVLYDVLSMDLTSDTAGMVVQTTQGVVFSADVPENITDGSLVDFLQTKSGHKTKAMDIEIPLNGVSVNVINFTASDVPTNFVVGDYICLINECIIPQIPTDLHNALAERACSRILSAIGDQQGLQASNQKLQEIEVRQGNILDNRATNDPTKILARKSLLRYGKSGRWYWR